MVLRGQYKLDANNNLYADGDVYPSSGQIGRNWSEEVDLGSLTWTYRSTNNIFSASLSDYMRPSASNVIVDAVCSKYIPATISDLVVDSTTDKVITMGRPSNWDGYIMIRDTAYTDAVAFKQHLTDVGAKLVYAKQIPTTENATPYTSPQWCDSNGTEEYVGSELPCGHNTSYPMTMIDCADGLGNGTYTPKLTVNNGKLSFEWQSV